METIRPLLGWGGLVKRAPTCHAVLRLAKPRGGTGVRCATPAIRCAACRTPASRGMVALEVRSYTLTRVRKEEQP